MMCCRPCGLPAATLPPAPRICSIYPKSTAWMPSRGCRTEPLITGYNDVRLAPGSHTLRIQARDSAFNYSAPAEVRFFVPRFVALPGGLRTRTDALYPALAVGSVRARPDHRVGRGQPAVARPQSGVDGSGGRAAAGGGRAPVQPLHLRRAGAPAGHVLRPRRVAAAHLQRPAPEQHHDPRPAAHGQDHAALSVG